MDRQYTIEHIKRELSAGVISKKDLQEIIEEERTIDSTSRETTNTSKVPSNKNSSSGGLITALYVVGAILAVVGVGILLAQNWVEIGFVGRLLASFGLALVMYISALLFRDAERRVISQVMFVISAILAPLGAYVLLERAGIDFSTYTTQMAIAFVLAALYGYAYFLTKRNVLVLLTMGNASWLFWALVMKMVSVSFYASNLFWWASIVLGVSYILIGYSYGSTVTSVDLTDKKGKQTIRAILYALGTLIALCGGIFIGGFFDVLFIIMVFGAFYGGVYLKSRSMLILGALFMIAHIIKLTARYFADSIGWPLALIIIGFIVISIGYLTYFLNRYYLVKEGNGSGK